MSTGGFTREARYEAERANVPLVLVDMPQLRKLLLEHSTLPSAHASARCRAHEKTT